MTSSRDHGTHRAAVEMTLFSLPPLLTKRQKLPLLVLPLSTCSTIAGLQWPPVTSIQLGFPTCTEKLIARGGAYVCDVCGTYVRNPGVDVDSMYLLKP